eukprot:m.209567 g.209567  ORF g.209567 m.209567 type:complete len:253 (+) comp18545_c1_seq2:228-986(+)
MTQVNHRVLLVGRSPVDAERRHSFDQAQVGCSACAIFFSALGFEFAHVVHACRVTDAAEKCWRAVMDERVMEEKVGRLLQLQFNGCRQQDKKHLISRVQRKEMQFDSWETFFEVLRKAFHEGHLLVQADVTKFFLLVGQRNPRRFELKQEVDAERCIQDCVFRLASKQHSQVITRLRHDLENCKRRLASSRSASASQSSPTHVDNSFARQLKRKPAGTKKKSENLVNPGRPIYKKSRKISFERKASSSEDDD